MKKITGIIGMYMLVALPLMVVGQYTVDPSSSKVIVAGTSSLHDWEIEAEEVKGKAAITIQNELKSIPTLNFTVVVDQLKSGKGAMDKNTYEALKESKYPEVTYTLKKINKITPAGNGKYKLSTTGDLAIAGTTKSIDMEVMAAINGSTVNFTGEYPMKMTAFNVEPPTAMFGTIKTGDEVTIKFNVNYKKS